MNYKLIFNVVVVTTVAAVFCISCGGGGGSKPASLTGQWVDVNPKPGDSEEFELFSDGTAAFKNGDLSVSGTWNIVDKRFVLTVSVGGTNMSEAYNYKLSGYELTLVNDKGDTSICVKKEKLKEFKEKQIAATRRDVEKTPTFTDSRDSKTYRRVLIGEQVWMAENLNYAAEDSKCYEDSDDNCAKYGRLYEQYKTACPAGWHLPKDDEWAALADFVGGDSTAGKKLKSTTGWNDNGNGTNDYGFSALPGGYGRLGVNDGFKDVGKFGYWWSATRMEDRNYALNRNIGGDSEKMGKSKNYIGILFSVRCVQD